MLLKVRSKTDTLCKADAIKGMLVADEAKLKRKKNCELLAVLRA